MTGFSNHNLKAKENEDDGAESVYCDEFQMLPK